MNEKFSLTLKAIRINNNWIAYEAEKNMGTLLENLRNYESFKIFPGVPIIEKILKVTVMKYDDIFYQMITV